jgi:CBS domain-containing protein
MNGDGVPMAARSICLPRRSLLVIVPGEPAAPSPALSARQAKPMTDSNAAFIQAYEALKEEINRRAGSDGGARLELEDAIDRDQSVAKHARLIRYIRDIRNALAHPHHRSRVPAVRITAEFLAETTRLLEALQNPPRAHSLCVPRRKLCVADRDQSIAAIADVMRAKRFSHIPILDRKDVLIGVFNEAAIYDYFFSRGAKEQAGALTIEDILAHCRLDAGHTETFGFVHPNATEDAIVARLTAVAGPSTRTGALFVTASGKASDPITGMLTPWDVLAARDA